MSDDTVTAFEGPDPSGDRDILLYDYSKHLLSLSLFGLGGVVSITQSTIGQKIPGPIAALLIAFVALAGLSALSCSASILRARERSQPVPKTAWLASRAAMVFLGMGMGGFLTIWVEVIL